jgi:hypothetical protein
MLFRILKFGLDDEKAKEHIQGLKKNSLKNYVRELSPMIFINMHVICKHKTTRNLFF